MKQYVALLRGINISGKNKVPMSELKKQFETLSFTNVKTYLNSGNVIFSSAEDDLGQLTDTIENMLKDQFGFEIPVFVILREALGKILNQAPDWWGNENEEIYDNLIFILPPATYEEVYQELGEPKEALEKVENYENAVFWSFSRKDYQKTNWWSKTANADIRTKLTIRTAGTVRKLSKNVIHLFGAAGSGTSTLGRYICEQTGYFFMDSDDYFWEPTNPPYVQKRDKEKRVELMIKDIEQHENVVISGSLTDWGDALIPLFTLAIRITTDTAIRLDRLKKRERQHFGSRIDVGGDMYETHQEFIEWAASYDDGGTDMRSRQKHDEWQKLLTCKLMELDGTADLADNFDKIRKYVC